jgi:threonine dehydrogenase-like Zn-dependent dehydrogenase
MLGTMLYGPRDVRCEDVPEPKILKPTDAIIRLSASCICGSDLWPFRGENEVTEPKASRSRSSCGNGAPSWHCTSSRSSRSTKAQ